MPKKKKAPTFKVAQNRIVGFKLCDPKSLKPWKKNPRRNEEAVDRLAKLIRAHGFVNPIIVDEGGGIIRAGHTRVLAAIKLGLKKIPVMVYRFESSEEAELYSIADNKSSEWSEWDEPMLQQVFAGLNKYKGKNITKDWMAVMSGFTPRELEGMAVGAHTSFVEHNFRQSMEEFEKSKPTEGRDPYWFWVVVPNKEIFELLRERLCAHERGREFVFEEFIELLQSSNRIDGLKELTRTPRGASLKTRKKVKRGD